MNVRYYLDTEFNSFGGSLISLGVVRDDGQALYLRVPEIDIERMTAEEGMDPWIVENILPVLGAVPHVDFDYYVLPAFKWGQYLSRFLYRDGEVPQVFVDWPSDAMDFCKLLMTGPGKAVDMGNQTHITILRHVDIYPTSLPGAVQHNALWDAFAIRQFVHEMS